MKNIEVSAAIIVFNNNKILTVERGYGEFKDKWEFPGGKLEEGETPKDAIIREIKEEMNADIDPIADLGFIEYDYPNFHLKMHCFICKLISENFSLLEHEDKKIVALEDLDSVDFLPADILVLPLIKAYFSKLDTK